MYQIGVYEMLSSRLGINFDVETMSFEVVIYEYAFYLEKITFCEWKSQKSVFENFKYF